MKWIINYEKDNIIEWDLEAHSFTLFRLLTKDNIVISCPVHPAIIDNQWYIGFMNKPIEDVKTAINNQLKTYNSQ